MKSGLNKRMYLVVSGLAAVLVNASISPALAVPFTDVNGNSCDTSMLVGGGPGGQSICPAGPPTPAQLKQMQSSHQTMLDREFLRDQKQQEEDDLDPLHGLTGGSIPGMGYSFHLGMTVSPASGFGDAALSGGGYSLRNGGAPITDSAGLIAGTSASYRTNAGVGSISGLYDASQLVGANQHLVFTGTFKYTSANTSFGGVGAGTSINGDNYSFKMSATYMNYLTYLRLTSGYEFGSDTETLGATTGSYNTDGNHVDAAVGHLFLFANTIGPAAQATSSQMALKAAAQKSIDGYAIGLDLSGHLGYSNDVARGFTDSSGFIYGNETTRGGETGLNAKFFAEIQRYGVIWKPYVSGSVTAQFGYSHIANFPGQLTLATGDAVTFGDATTFYGAKVGLDVTARNGWTVGVNGFYNRSSDTEIIGGRAYVNIPLGPTLVTARY